MPIPLQQAQDLIAAAHQHAVTLGVPVTVVVVDEGGHLVALGRMDGAFALSPQIAEAKAVGRLTRVPLIPGLGSVILRDGGRVLGAVGVSGGSSEQDLECALAGLRS